MRSRVRTTRYSPKRFMAVLIAAALLLSGGCGKKSEQAALPSDPGGAAMSEPGGKIENRKVGVEECDTVIQKYSRCLDRLPESNQQAMQKGLEQARRTWQSAAKNPERHDSLVASCRKMGDTLAVSMRAQGCDW